MILNKEQYMERLKQRIGESTSEEDLKFLEDMTDTFNSLQSEANVDWKEKYQQLDQEWKERYKERFFNGAEDDKDNNNNTGSNDIVGSEEDLPEDVKLEDQFLSSLENVTGLVVAV